jgi:hypothetical protein
MHLRVLPRDGSATDYNIVFKVAANIDDLSIKIKTVRLRGFFKDGNGDSWHGILMNGVMTNA